MYCYFINGETITPRHRIVRTSTYKHSTKSDDMYPKYIPVLCNPTQKVEETRDREKDMSFPILRVSFAFMRFLRLSYEPRTNVG